MNAECKVIKSVIDSYPIRDLFVQTENNADTIIFLIDTEYENLIWRMRAVNANKELIISNVLSSQLDEEYLKVAWPVTESFLALSGELHLILTGSNSSNAILYKAICTVNIARDRSVDEIIERIDSFEEQYIIDVDEVQQYLQITIPDIDAKKHTHSNKSLLDTYTQTDSNLEDSVSKRHEHLNKSLLDTYTQTDVDLEDAVLKKHTHDNIELLNNLGSKIEEIEARLEALENP